MAEHTSDNNSQLEEYLSSSTRNRIKITSLVNQDHITTNTTSSYEEDQQNGSVIGIENIKVILLPTANLTNRSTIVVPNSIDEKIKFVSIDKSIPDSNAIEKCSLNNSYCIKVDNYPREDLLNLFRTSKFMSNNYYDTDDINEVNDFETRMSDSQLSPFCQSRDDGEKKTRKKVKGLDFVSKKTANHSK
ncbi:protein spaetzle-like [Aphis craccivora]|uniref:Protein spaetzle-like n=1 Tax=Aphis craccivora TaxID=307492 RepID=A0A6G0Z3C6_APHCR|nr:protein spaetzle-like [Aphis craccivora]